MGDLTNPVEQEVQQHDVLCQLLEWRGESLMLWDAEGRLAWLSSKARSRLEASQCRSEVERLARLALRHLRRTDDATRDRRVGGPRRVGLGAPLIVEFSWVAGRDCRPWLVAELEECSGPRADLARLSGAEAHVLQLLVLGLSNREISEQLSVSNETVKTHVKRILARLGVKSRAKAANIARGISHAAKRNPAQKEGVD